MAKLVAFEFKKLFCGGLLPSVTVLLFIFNGLMLFRESQSTVGPGYTRSDVGAVYDDLEGMTALEAEEWLTEYLQYLEAVEVWQEWTQSLDSWNDEDREYFEAANADIMESYPDIDLDAVAYRYLDSLYSEMELVDDILEQVSAAAHYNEYLEQIDEAAAIMTRSSLFGTPGTYSYRNALLTPGAYADLKGIILPAADSEGVLFATEQRITDVFILLILIAAAISMLIKERSSGTLMLIKPAKRGYLDTIAAKLAVMLLIAAGVTVLFYAQDFVMAAVMFGLGDLSRPIQSLAGFITSPYLITVGEYLAYFMLAKLAAAVMFASLLFCIGTVFRNMISAVVAIAAALLAETVLYISIPLNSWLSPLKLINIVCLADTSWFFEDYLNMNIFSYAVNVVPVGIAAAFMITAASCIFSCFRYTHEKSAMVTADPIAEKIMAYVRLLRGRGSMHAGLLGKEIYKLFIMEGGLALLAVFLLVQIASYSGYSVSWDTDDTYYRYYILWADGITLDEVGELYEAEAERYDALAAELAAWEGAYADGDITYTELLDLQWEYKAETKGLSGFYLALEQYYYVQGLADQGVDADLICVSAWTELLGSDGHDADVYDAAKLLFFLAAGLASVFSIEKSTHVEMLQHTCPRGRSYLCRCKYAACLLYTVAACLIAYVPRYIAVFSAYGTDGLLSPLHSLELLASVPLNVPLIVYLFMMGISRLAGAVITAGIVMLLSKKTGDNIKTVIISLLLLEIPVILCVLGMTGELYITLLPLLTGYSVFKLPAWKLLYWIAAVMLGALIYIKTYDAETGLVR